MFGGAVTEFAQGFVNRDPSTFDVLRDAWGAAAALVAYAALAPRGLLRGRGRWRALGAAVALGAFAVMLAPLGLSVLAYAHRDLAYPTLAQWCSPLDRYFLRPVAAHLTGVSAPLPRVAPLWHGVTGGVTARALPRLALD